MFVKVTPTNRTLSFVVIHPFYYFVLAFRFRYYKMALPSEVYPNILYNWYIPVFQFTKHFDISICVKNPTLPKTPFTKCLQGKAIIVALKYELKLPQGPISLVGRV